jgi:hypothetical protein
MVILPGLYVDSHVVRSVTVLTELTCFLFLKTMYCNVGYAVAKLVETLGYKSEGRGFDYRWCLCNISLT